MLFSNLSPEGLLSQSGTASGCGGEWGRRTSPGPRCVHARGGGKRSDVPKTLQGATWHAARAQPARSGMRAVLAGSSVSTWCVYVVLAGSSVSTWHVYVVLAGSSVVGRTTETRER